MAAVASRSLQLTSDVRVQGFFHKGVGLRPRNAQWAPKRSFHLKSKVAGLVNAQASSTDLAAAADWGEPISLGTVKLPANVNLQKLEGLLYQWGNSLTQNANLPLPLPIKVDKIEGGVRLGYIRLVNGVIEDLAHIDCVVYSGSTKESSAMFRAVRCGRYKNEVPPGEPIIMQSLLQALKKSIELSSV
eukprot:c16110_g1_i1 orf=73-636(+)